MMSVLKYFIVYINFPVNLTLTDTELNMILKVIKVDSIEILVDSANFK